MAAAVANGNGVSTSTTVDDISKPPEGIVVPPKDIRGASILSVSSLLRSSANTFCSAAIVEKTAGYAARNGPVFERKFAQNQTLFHG